MNKKYEKTLYNLARKAYSNGDTPVSAIIVCNEKIIAKAYNKRNYTKNPLKHAEIECIIKATNKLNDWRLNNCDMYTLLEPCHMCMELIKEVRLKNVYYFVKNSKKITYKTKINKIESSYSQCFSNLLKDFFKNLRN